MYSGWNCSKLQLQRFVILLAALLASYLIYMIVHPTSHQWKIVSSCDCRHYSSQPGCLTICSNRSINQSRGVSRFYAPKIDDTAKGSMSAKKEAKGIGIDLAIRVTNSHTSTPKTNTNPAAVPSTKDITKSVSSHLPPSITSALKSKLMSFQSTLLPTKSSYSSNVPSTSVTFSKPIVSSPASNKSLHTLSSTSKPVKTSTTSPIVPSAPQSKATTTNLSLVSTSPASTTSTVTTPEPTYSITNMGECHHCLAGKRLITVNKRWICGQPRIGNKMFMMAAGIGAAASWNITFVLPQQKNCVWMAWLSDMFVSVNSTVPLLPDNLMKDWHVSIEAGFTEFNAIKPLDQNISLIGFRQSWKYFQSDVAKKSIWDAFQFNLHYEIFATNTLQTAKSMFNVTDAIFVGVHMRVGDLKTNDRITYGYQMANKSFYDKAVNSVKAFFNKSDSIIFVVASDTVGDARNMLADIENTSKVYWSQGTAFQDFATLSKCNHSVISGGTYGFWTAWLAGGETFYFSNFSKPGTKFHRGFISENFYLPHWKPIGWYK